MRDDGNTKRRYKRIDNICRGTAQPYNKSCNVYRKPDVRRTHMTPMGPIGVASKKPIAIPSRRMMKFIRISHGSLFFYANGNRCLFFIGARLQSGEIEIEYRSPTRRAIIQPTSTDSRDRDTNYARCGVHKTW